MKRWAGLIPHMAAIRAGRLVRPRLLTYTVTFSCNARCAMCDSWKKEKPEELDAADIARIFKQLPAMDAVRLTGGEPFLRKDLLDIDGLAQSELRPRLIHITTNALLVNRIVEFCENRSRKVPLYLLVSLDGREKYHNAVRGIPKAYASATTLLRELAPRQESLSLRLAVNQTVLDQQGLVEYEGLRRELEGLDIGHQVVVAYDESATYAVNGSQDMAPEAEGAFATHDHFPPAAMQRLWQLTERDAGRLKAMQRLVKTYYMTGMHNRLVAGIGRPNPPCVALRSHLRLFPDGSVPTCQFNTNLIGSLRRQSFAELWLSPTAKTQRRWVDRCPGCWAECEVLPNALYSGDIVRALWPGFSSELKPKKQTETSPARL